MLILYNMSFLKKLFQGPVTQTTSLAKTGPLTHNTQIIPNFKIPEPTRSLLWVTTEDVEHIGSASCIHIHVDFSSGEAGVEHIEGALNAEPSLIWTKLPIEKNEELEEEAMYFPAYSTLSPKCRYQYLRWLQDVTKETNLSYVFLYYYGLERHLVAGDYDSAVDEILRLLKYHDKGTFRSYATTALIASSLHKKRKDIIERAPFICKEISNEGLVFRMHMDMGLTPDDLIELASEVGFKNKRYIKKFPDKFKEVLGNMLNEYQNERGFILQSLNINNVKQEEWFVFANISFPEKTRYSQIPQILKCKDFKEPIKMLLEKTHTAIKGLSQKRLL